MKSLHILPFAALAAFVPGAHASGNAIEKFKDDPTSRFIPDLQFDPSPVVNNPYLHHKIMSKVSAKDVKDVALVSRWFNELVEDLHKRLPAKKLTLMLKLFDINIKTRKFEILQAFGMLSKHSGDKPNIPLGAVIQLIGPDELLKHPKKAKELARLSLQSSSDDARATVVTDAAVAADPRSLLQLRRAAGPDPVLDKLFTQNAQVFEGGLKIDVHWLDNLDINKSLSSDPETDKLWKGDFMKWFVEEYLLKDPHPATRFSHSDVCSLLGWITFSHPKLQVLTPKPSLTQHDLTAISANMFTVLDAIIRKFDYKPSLKELLLLEPGPFKNAPALVAITAGFKAYLHRRPSSMALFHALIGLLDDQALGFYHPILSNFRQSIISFSHIAAMNAEDMLWLSGTWGRWILGNARFDALRRAFKIICGNDPMAHGVPNCSESDYYKKAPNGVLSWRTQGQQIWMLINVKDYTAAYWRLTEAKNFNLIPDRFHGGVASILRILQNAVNGNDLSKPDFEAISEFFEL